MSRKSIRRELHGKKVDHTKPLAVIGQRGQLRIPQSDKVSEEVEEKEETATPPKVEADKKEDKAPESEEAKLPVVTEEPEPETEPEKAGLVEIESEVEPTEVKEDKAPEVEDKKPQPKAKKVVKKGRPRKSASVTDKKEE